MALLTDDQQDLQKMVQEFVKKEIAPNAAHYDHTEEFPWDSIQKMAALGLMGIPIPEAYEGTELDTVSYMLTIEEISKACAATGAILAVHTSAGTMPILLFGTEAQKLKYIPPPGERRKVGSLRADRAGCRFGCLPRNHHSCTGRR